MLDRRRWHHVVLTTYGAWLPGDERGYRTRHGRGPVRGHYKSPPETHQHINLRQNAEASLTQAPVVLIEQMRAKVGAALQTKLAGAGAWTLCLAVSGQHVHLLVKMIPLQARQTIGIAKKHATFTLRAAGWQGKLWGVRSKITAIRNRSHQRNAYRYILRHEEQRAWVGVWKEDPLAGDG